MKQEKGFSLLEVLIAGGLMVGVVMAAQSLLSSTSRSAGDLEKRFRHRDLIDDIRFAFYDNARCLELIKANPFANDVGMAVPVHQGLAKTGADLPSYGIRVVKLSLQNVKEIPRDTFTLLLPNRQLAGQYQEGGRTADLVLEAQLMGTANRPLKATVVQRLTWLNRSGAITEELCFGNHDIPHRNTSGAASAGESVAEGRAAAAADSGAITLYGSPDERDKRPGAGHGGDRSPKPLCYLTESELVALSGRDRLLEGESLIIAIPGGDTLRIECDRGGTIRTTKVGG